MGPPVTLPSSLVGIREAIKGNFDSKEMQRTATAGFYAGFVGQGIEYTQIISKADYQLSLLIVTQKGLNAAANPLTYVEYFRNFSPQEKLEAAKRTAKGAWNGEYDSALGRKTGAAILDYLLVAIGGALMKGESAACEVAESGSNTKTLFRGDRASVVPDDVFKNGFKPKGTHNDALLHTKSNTTAGNFVSTSGDIVIATEFAGKNGYVYVIRTNNYVDINSIYGAGAYFPEQMEFSIPGGIKPYEIVGAYKKQGGKIIGDFIPNPNFGGN